MSLRTCAIGIAAVDQRARYDMLADFIVRQPDLARFVQRTTVQFVNIGGLDPQVAAYLAVMSLGSIYADPQAVEALPAALRH